MIIKNSEMIKEVKKNMRGGEGEVSLLHYVNKEELKNARLMTRITIPAGAGIGEHDHVNETEYYIILSGEGIVNDDGVEKTVSPGEVVVTGNGAKHSIRNNGSADLVMIAVIITY